MTTLQTDTTEAALTEKQTDQLDTGAKEPEPTAPTVVVTQTAPVEEKPVSTPAPKKPRKAARAQKEKQPATRTSGLNKTIKEKLGLADGVEERAVLAVAHVSSTTGRASFAFGDRLEDKTVALAVFLNPSNDIDSIFAIPAKLCPKVLLMKPDESSKFYQFKTSKAGLEEAMKRAAHTKKLKD